MGEEEIDLSGSAEAPEDNHDWQDAQAQKSAALIQAESEGLSRRQAARKATAGAAMAFIESEKRKQEMQRQEKEDKEREERPGKIVDLLRETDPDKMTKDSTEEPIIGIEQAKAMIAEEPDDRTAKLKKKLEDQNSDSIGRVG